MTRGELDRDAVLRIAAAVKKRGPGIVRRAHFFHRAKPVGIAVGLVTAVVLAAQWGREEAAVDARTCASWDDRAIENELDDGSVRLEIGRRALAVASTGSDVTVQTLLPCSTVLSLERGRVVVHARDLGGGELRVESGAGQVVVHGTVFAVERAGDRLEVEVAEGRVELIAGERIAIAAGKRAGAEA